MICVIYVLCLSCIAALWSPEGKGLTSWLLFVMFIVIVLLSHLVSWDMCGTLLYRFLILADFLTLNKPKMGPSLFGVTVTRTQQVQIGNIFFLK